MNWYLENGKDSDVILSSRIRFARNIKEFPFKIRMTKQDREKMLEKIKFVTPSIGYGLKFMYLKDMDDITKMALVEKHIISPEMALAKEEEAILIIHGIGTGIVKKAVHEELKHNKKVKEFKLDNFNPGCTIVKLNINNNTRN